MGVCPSRSKPPHGEQSKVRVMLHKEAGYDDFAMKLQREPGGRVLIKSIRPGSRLVRWNEAHPEKDIGVGDWVVSCNTSIWPKEVMSTFSMSNLTLNSVYMLIERNPERVMNKKAEENKEKMEFVEKLPTDLSGAKDTECSICLCELDNGDDVVVLPCQHGFHKECAEAWLTHGRSLRCAQCPTCRTDLVEQPNYAMSLEEEEKILAAMPLVVDRYPSWLQHREPASFRGADGEGQVESS